MFDPELKLSFYIFYMLLLDVDQNPVPPVNFKVDDHDGHPLYHMISRF